MLYVNIVYTLEREIGGSSCCFSGKILTIRWTAKRNNMLKQRNKLCLAVLLCLACACTNRPKDVLDMRDMTDVLVDIHTLDGVFASTSYNRFKPEERDAYYEAILVKHHITQAQFDSSLLWYSRDPKKFEKVYTRVIDQLTAEEAAVKAGKYHELLPKASTITHMDLWTDSTRFTLRGDSLSCRPLAFSVADTSLVMGDVYELRFLMRVGRGDSCPGLHTHFNLHYAGGRIDSIYLPLHADSLWRRYTLRLRARQGEKVDSLHGRFFAAGSCLCAQQADVDSISLVRWYDPEQQETLRTTTRQREAIRTFRYRMFPTPGEGLDFIFHKNKVNQARI